MARAPVPLARVAALLDGRPRLAAAAADGAALGRSAFSAGGGEVRATFVLCNSDGARPWGWDFSGAAELLLAPALARLGPQLRVTVESDVLFCPPLGGPGGPGGRRGELPLEEVPARLQGAWGGLPGGLGGGGGEAGGGAAAPAPELRFVLFVPGPAERPAALVAPDGRRSEACLVPDLGGVVLLGPGPLEAAEAQAAAAAAPGGGGAFVLSAEDLAPAFGAFLAQLGRLLGVERGPAAAGGVRGGRPLPLAVPPAPLSLAPEWDAEGAVRRHALYAAARAVASLRSVSRLIEDLRTLPVPAAVADGIRAGVEALEALEGALARGDWEAAPGLARAAARAAEGALHHESMLAELHIPPEQIAAVFIPFWFPAAVTSASNLSRAARAWRRARAPA